MTGAYPTRAQLLTFAGLSDEPSVVPQGVTLLNGSDGCGCGPTGCC
jgi:hypothetical protein